MAEISLGPKGSWLSLGQNNTTEAHLGVSCSETLHFALLKLSSKFHIPDVVLIDCSISHETSPKLEKSSIVLNNCVSFQDVVMMGLL